MQVRVVYFSLLRDRAGTRREVVTVDEGTTVGQLKEHLGNLHSALVPSLPTTLAAVNREFAFPGEVLHEGDEVALFPPVSGGGASGPTVFRLTEAPLDLNALIDEIMLPTTGAACVFTGVVRARTERGAAHDTEYLEYEAYEPMAEAKMRQVADEIRGRWPDIEGIAIVQRVGTLLPGTPTVLIACTAAHRDHGLFEAARYGIDRLKEIVPVWKKEVGPGGEAWVEGEYQPGPGDRSP
jgi:molybdopterin synthase catalytic subunit